MVFQTRNDLLHTRRPAPGTLLRGGAAIAVSLALSLAAVLAVLSWVDKAPEAGMAVLALVYGALLCSQGYQVVSTLNFVEQRFTTINRITLLSAATVLALGFAFVPMLRSAESLASLLLAGWLVQIVLTLWFLARRNLR